MSQLDDLRKIFVAEVDDELRAENEEQIREWEEALIHNEGLLSWTEHEITQTIMKQARLSLIDVSIGLATNRHMSEGQRAIEYGKQDAMRWLLSFASSDPRAELERIKTEIRTALNATN